MKKKILILSYKPVLKDTRIQNQIKALSIAHDVDVNYLNKNEYTDKNTSIEFFIKFYHLLLYHLTKLSRSGVYNFFKQIVPKFFRQFILKFFKQIFIITQLLLKKIRKFYKNFMNCISLLKITFLLIKQTKKNNYDLVLSNDLFTLPTAVYFKIIYGSRIIYDMHEYELDRYPRPSIIKKIMLIIGEELLIPFADVILTVSYNIKHKYKKRFKKKISILLNSPEKQNYYKNSNEQISRNPKNFICIGNISFGRNIEELLFYFINNKKKKILFLGHLNENFEKFTNFKKIISNYSNIIHMDAVPPDEIYSIQNQYCSSLFFYDTSYKNYDFALPNKLIISLLYNHPIICFKSKELLDFEKRFNIKLNLINSIQDLNNIVLKPLKICPKLKQFLSVDRQAKVLKRYVDLLLR